MSVAFLHWYSKLRWTARSPGAAGASLSPGRGPGASPALLSQGLEGPFFTVSLSPS